MSTYQLHIPVRSHAYVSRLSLFVGISLCLLVGLMLGLLLASYVAINWVKLDTPPMYEQTQGELFP